MNQQKNEGNLLEQDLFYERDKVSMTTTQIQKLTNDIRGHIKAYYLSNESFCHTPAIVGIMEDALSSIRKASDCLSQAAKMFKELHHSE